MNRHRLSRALAVTVAAVPALALALAGTPALAQSDTSVEPDVARVSVISGGVDVKRADSGDTVAAAVNAPISTGDYVTTQDDSQAEIQFDYGTELRIAPNTQLRFTQLDPQSHQLQLAQGLVDLRVFRGLNAHAEIQTPQATIRPDESGSYLINVDNDGNSQITVRAGRADVVTESGTQSLVPGNTLAINGDTNNPQFQTVATVAYDAFDRWNQERDRYFADAGDYRYTDAGMVGADDLHSYGRWVEDPQYGQVWVPTVAAGWAPYHDGRWVWEPYYGWTWVDAEPWGWAPFHYGNWFYARSGWAWYPGAYAVARPYFYRPALVAFFNFGGGGGGFSLGFGNIGWVPIAPFEPFRPWWRGYGGGYYGGGYFNRTTIVNNTYVNNTTINNINITKVYRNINVPGAIVGVHNANFADGNFRHVVALEPTELRNAQPVRGVLPIVPTQRNLAYGHGVVAHPVAPVARFANFRTQPKLVAIPFARQQTAVKAVTLRTYPTNAAAISRFSSGVRATSPITQHEAKRVPDATVRSPELAPRSNLDSTTRARTNSTTGSPFDRFDRQAAPGTAGTAGTATGARTTLPSYARPQPTTGDTPNAARATRPTTTVPSYARPQRARVPSAPTARANDAFGRFGDGAVRQPESTPPNLTRHDRTATPRQEHVRATNVQRSPASHRPETKANP